MNDFTKLELKPDHFHRPLWACADGRIILETYSPLYKQAYDFLIAIAEPVCRPEFIHEYNLTPHSLYAAVSIGLETETIVRVLNQLSKTKLPKEMIDFIHASTSNYGKVKLVLKKNQYFVESSFPEVIKTLLGDEVISRARLCSEGSSGTDSITISKAVREIESAHDELLNGIELAVAEEKEMHSFEVNPAQVENVKQRCLPNALNYPMLEEYDFRNDTEKHMANQTMVLSVKPAGPSEKVRNWLDLPVGVMHRIFLKIGAIDIIFRAQAVCTEWRNISKEPLLFRCIDMRQCTSNLFKKSTFSERNKIDKSDFVETAKLAVNRSCGQLVEFTMGGFCTDELLAYIADRSASLKLLRLVSCNKVSAGGLIYISKKVPMLKKLEIVYCSFLAQTLEAVAESFPSIKSFMLVNRFNDNIEDDFDAEVISKNMPELRHLYLHGNQLTSEGLYSIVHSCSHLKSLNLRACFNCKIEGDLFQTCTGRRMKIVFPNGSICDPDSHDRDAEDIV